MRDSNRRTARAAALAVAVLALLAACAAPTPLAEPVEQPIPGPGGVVGVAGAATPTPPPTEAVSPSPFPSPSPSAPPPPAPLTIAFAGDVHGEWPIAGVLADGENPLEGVASRLRRADLAVVNLETAVGTRGRPDDKQYTFQAPSSLLDALAGAGVDVVSVANNHALDYGRDALAETLALARAAGLRPVGGGADAREAYAPALFEFPGTVVAVVGLSRVLPTTEWAAGPSRPGLASGYDVDRAVAAVAGAAAVADLVVVTVHWGQERAACPDGGQRRLAEALAEAGAHVIAGHHPHVLQGVEEVGGALVAWSLGNFVFYAAPGETRLTGIWQVRVADELDWTFSPAVIDDRGRPQPATGADARRIRALLADRSPGGGACPPPP